jgi:uncharacterized protein YegP (UPF0339 family)
MRLHTLTISKDAVGAWRWSIQASNGNIVGASTEGYKRPASATDNLATVTNIEARFRSSPRDAKSWICPVDMGDRKARSRYITVVPAVPS